MSTPNRQANSGDWPKAIAGILFLMVIIGFGTAHSMTPERRELIASMLPLRAVPTPALTLQQWRDQAKSVPYNLLAHNPDRYEGELISFRGEVLLILEQTSDRAELIVLVEDGNSAESENSGRLVLHSRHMPHRVAFDDRIVFVGVMNGIDQVHQVPKLTAMALQVE